MAEPDALLALFAEYNPVVWPVQVVAPAAALAGLALIWRRPSRSVDRAVVAGLAGLWLLIGVVFQGIYVRQVDEVLGIIYAAVFLGQAGLLVALGVIGDRVALRPARTPTALLGGLIIVYALVVYPIIGAGLGHPYPEAPLFGAAPCPTTIFTFGLFLLARRPFPKLLLGVPLFWALVATPAAVGRGVLEDVALLAAGVVATAVILVAGRASRGAHPARAAVNAQA